MLSRAELKQQAKEQLKGNVGSYFLVLLASVGVALVISFIGGLLSSILPILGMIAIYAAVAPLSMGIYMVFLNGTYGEKPKVATLFEAYKPPMLGKSILLFVLQFIFIYLWTLLFIIPGIVKSFSYAMAWYILAENPNMTAREAITESRRIMNGHKFEYFVLSLSFILWMLLCTVTLGIAYIYVAPYMQLTFTNFYHNIKSKDAAPVSEVVEEAVVVE